VAVEGVAGDLAGGFQEVVLAVGMVRLQPRFTNAPRPILFVQMLTFFSGNHSGDRPTVAFEENLVLGLD
jgi:hypothetical protein